MRKSSSTVSTSAGAGGATAAAGAASASVAVARGASIPPESSTRRPPRRARPDGSAGTATSVRRRPAPPRRGRRGAKPSGREPVEHRRQARLDVDRVLVEDGAVEPRHGRRPRPRAVDGRRRRARRAATVTPATDVLASSGLHSSAGRCGRRPLEAERGVAGRLVRGADLGDRVPVLAEGLGLAGREEGEVGLVVGVDAGHQLDVGAVVVGEVAVPGVAEGVVAPGPLLLAGRDVLVGPVDEAGAGARGRSRRRSRRRCRRPCTTSARGCSGTSRGGRRRACSASTRPGSRRRSSRPRPGGKVMTARLAWSAT